jgi:hypothetical protein
MSSMSNLEKALNAFLGGLIIIAVAAVLVKPGSQTPQALTSAGTAVGSSLYAAQGIR